MNVTHKLWIRYLFITESAQPQYQENTDNDYYYSDIMMGATASQITSLTIVYLTVYSGADQRKYQSSASLALWGEFTGDQWISRAKDQ